MNNKNILAAILSSKIETNNKLDKILEILLATQHKPNAQIGATAQSKAAELWKIYRYAAEIGCKGKKTTYADVFNACRRELSMLDINDSKTFRKVVRNYQKNVSRWINNAK